MTAFTLVLPFALPPSELAADLLKHLEAPSLATLLSRTSSTKVHPRHEGLHVLPHERWLARALFGADEAAWTPAVMRGFGLAQEEGTWFTVHPAHIEIARSHLLLNDVRQLGLTDAHSRALFDAALPYVRELGLDLVYGDAAAWFLRADTWDGMRTSSPDAAAGLDISFFMPSGPGAAPFRRLQNELQILWHENAPNMERESRRQGAVNAIWPWAGGSAPPAAATQAAPIQRTAGQAHGMPAAAARPAPSADGMHGVPLFVDATAPAWLTGLARATGGGTLDASTLPASDAILYSDMLTAPTLAGDWTSWIAAFDTIERDLVAPLLAALQSGRAHEIRVVLTGRDTRTDTTATRFALRKFWRRPTLNTLLT